MASNKCPINGEHIGHFLDGKDYLSETPVNLTLSFLTVTPKTKLLEEIQSDLNV